jgi:hypothetical protein
MNWNSSIYLKEINSIYRSSSNEKSTKGETLFKNFFDNKKYVFVKAYDVSEKFASDFKEEDFKITEIGLEYIGNTPPEDDDYIKKGNDYFVRIDTFEKVLNTFLEGFPLIEILKNNKGFIAGGLFARLFIYFSSIDSSTSISDIFSKLSLEAKEVFNIMSDVFEESDIDIYVQHEDSKRFLESMVKQESFYIIDVNTPTGYNTFLERNKIMYRIRCCIVLRNKKVPLDIMVTEEEPVRVIGNFDLTAAQWGFDGNQLKYFGTEEEDFFKRICHVNSGYIHDVLCGNPITIKRLSKYADMTFFIKVDETKQKIEKVNIDTDDFPNLHWTRSYRYRKNFRTRISEEDWEKVNNSITYRYKYSSSLRNITQNHFYSSIDEDNDVVYYSPVNLERIFHQKLKSQGFKFIKKWSFVKLFVETTFHQQQVLELSKTNEEGVKNINKYWLEMIFNTNGTSLAEWGMDVKNPGWAGILNYLRQILKSRGILVKNANEYKQSFKDKEEDELHLLKSNYNSLISLDSSVFQSTDLKTSRYSELRDLYGSIKWLRKYFDQSVFVTSDKDYISDTLNFWDIGGRNIVSLEGLKWLHQPYEPDNNFFFVQLSWWNRGAMKERVLYCYNNFMNVNKIYPWVGCPSSYKSIFTQPTEKMWIPDIDFLRKHQKYLVLRVSELDTFVVEPEEDEHIIYDLMYQKNKDINTLKDLISSQPSFTLQGFVYDVITASINEDENEILLCLDSMQASEKYSFDSSIEFSKQKYKTVFNVEFEDPIMFEEKTIKTYLEEDFRHFVIIIKGPDNYEDLITTSWIDKLPNGMDDYNRISNCYFKSQPHSNRQHTIYRRFGYNRTLIAEDYLSRCAFSKPKLNDSIGTYTHWKRACDVHGRMYVPRGVDITNLLQEEQKKSLFEQITKATTIISDNYLEEMCKRENISFYDYFMITDDEDQVSMWVPITDKMKDGDYSEQLLEYRDRIMLVDVEEINKGDSDRVVVGNPDFWCINDDRPYNIFGYQGDIHTHLGASQHTDSERFSVRAQVMDTKKWDCEVSNYFENHASINWENIFYDKKDQIFGTPLKTMTVGNVPDTPHTLQ